MFNVQAIQLAYNRVYVVDSHDARVLIDTGPDYKGAWDALQSAIAGRAPDAVISTHGHNDHAGLGRRWQDIGVPVVLDDDDHHLALQPPLTDAAEMTAFTDYVKGTGAPSAVQHEAITGLEERRRWARQAATAEGYPPAGRGTRWPTGIRMAPFQPNPTGEVDEVLRNAGLEIVRCPGHTPGNVVVAAPEQGVLFSGDQLLPDITPTPGIQMCPPSNEGRRNRFPSLPAFAESLATLQKSPWSRCYPGHGDAFDDVAGRIQGNLAGIDERTARVREVLRDLGEARVYDVAERLYPRALNRRFWQIVATVQGNIDLLVESGEAREEAGAYRLA